MTCIIASYSKAERLFLLSADMRASMPDGRYVATMDKLVTIKHHQTGQPLCSIALVGPSAYCVGLRQAANALKFSTAVAFPTDVGSVLSALFDYGMDKLWTPVHDTETGLLDIPVTGIVVSPHGIFSFWSHTNVHWVTLVDHITLAIGSGGDLAMGFITGYRDAVRGHTQGTAPCTELHKLAHEYVGTKLPSCSAEYTHIAYTALLAEP